MNREHNYTHKFNDLIIITNDPTHQPKTHAETYTGLNCTPPAIDDFPPDFFTRQQRQSGAVVLHAIGSLYLFLALAVVCDKYFVPAVEKICTGMFCPPGFVSRAI